MTILRAQDIAPDDTLEADICVVGSGAAGLTLARRLDGIGRRVIVLEAGGFEHDEAAEADSFEIEHAGVPYRNPIASRGRWFGGSTNLWFGRIAKPQAIDLAHRPWVAHSGWPLTFEALDPWIDVAAEILAVPHHDKLAIENWPTNPTIQTFAGDGCTDLGVFLWSTDMYMARHARPGDRAIERRRARDRRDGHRARVRRSRRSSRTSRSSARADADSRSTRPVRARRRWSREPTVVAGVDRVVSRPASGTSTTTSAATTSTTRGARGLARVDLRGLSDAQVERLAMLDERVDSPYGKTQLRVVFTEQLQRSEQLLNHRLHGYLVADAHRSPGFESYKRLAERVRRRHVERPASTRSRIWPTMARSTPQLVALGIQRARGAAPTDRVRRGRPDGARARPREPCDDHSPQHRPVRSAPHPPRLADRRFDPPIPTPDARAVP